MYAPITHQLPLALDIKGIEVDRRIEDALVYEMDKNHYQLRNFQKQYNLILRLLLY